MINKNKLTVILLILLVPLLSGCSVNDQVKKTDFNNTDWSEILKDDSVKVNTNTSTSTEQTKQDTGSTIAPSAVTTTINKITNNLNKNNSMDQFDANKQYVAVVHTTLGDFTINFNKNQTPKTVENFVTLAKKGFYDKTIFHRVMKGFMIQGGDPKGNGTGGPGYKFADEPFDGEYLRGTVAMANSGPNTNGSQFFIMHANVPLPKNYVIFGHVTEGMETVDKIANAEVEYNNGEMSKPINPVKIVSIKVVE
jgi:cyclophilin family peptidyl-prolyl cis-trans isomerase